MVTARVTGKHAVCGVSHVHAPRRVVVAVGQDAVVVQRDRYGRCSRHDTDPIESGVCASSTAERWSSGGSRQVFDRLPELSEFWFGRKGWVCREIAVTVRPRIFLQAR